MAVDNPNALEETTVKLDEDVNTAVSKGVDLASIEEAVPNSGVQSAVQGSAEDAAEVEAMFPIDPLDSPETYVQEIPITWSDEAASEMGAYTAIANNAADPVAVYDRVMEDLKTIGTSEEFSAAESGIQAQNIENEIEAASSLMTSDLFRNDPSLKEAVAKQLQIAIQEAKAFAIADETTLQISDGGVVDAEEGNDTAVAIKSNQKLADRLATTAKIKGLVAESADAAFSWSAQTGLDLLGTLVSVNDANSYANLLNHLEIKWAGLEVLAPGEMLDSVREYAAALPMQEKYELALSMQEFLSQNAGVLDTNAVQAVNMMSSVFNDYIGGDVDGFDWDRWLINVGPTLDLLTIGAFSAVKHAVTAPIKMAKLSRLNRTQAANPTAAAEAVEVAMKDTKTAEMLGTTKEELLVKNATPKLDGWKEAQTPSVVSNAVKRAEDEVELLKEAGGVEDIIAASRGKKEALKELEDLQAKSKGHNLWLADTELVGEVGKPWITRALVGKSKGWGFASKDEAKKILTDTYKGAGVILTRTNRIDGVEEIVEAGQSVAKATKQLIHNLEKAKGTKLPRGEEKALRKELAALQAEVKALKPTTPTSAAGTKASQEAAATEAKIGQRSVEPLEREIAEIESMLDQSTQGARAEANISRLHQGQIDKLDKDVKAQFDKLTADKKVQEAKPSEENLEYFIKVESKGDIKFSDDTVQNSWFAQHGSWLFDADSKFAKELSQLGNAVFDKWKFLEKEMLHDLDSFAKLSGKEQAALSRVLARGAEEERLFTPAFLRREGFSQKAIDAYADFRRAMDKAFTLENRIHRKGLTSDGMVYIKGEEYDSFARPLSATQASGVRQAYNPITKTIESVDVAALYKNGQQIGQLKSTQMLDGVGTNYVKLDGIEVRDLPEITLSYNQGWLPRTNRSNYFITKDTEVVVDGAKQTRSSTVGVAHSLKDAEARAATLQESAEAGVTFGQKHDRELTAQADFAQNLHELYSTSGGLFYGKKGDRLKDAKGMSSDVIDPLEAAVRAVSRISRDSTMKPYVDDLKSRFVSTYQHLLRDKGSFPATASDIFKKGKVGDQEVIDAKAMFQHIEILDGLSTGAGFRRNSIILADYAERKLGKVGDVIAKGLRSIADSDPVSWTRARNFELNLASNPLAQLVVQPSQTLNMIALGPKTFVPDFRRGRLVSKLAAKRADVTKSDAELAPLARSLSMTTEELRADIRSFRRSGGGAAVTSHETARDAAKPLSSAVSGSLVRRGVNIATTPYRKGIGFLGKGFERGESINIGVHWQVAKRRWQKKNPDLSPYTPEAEFAIAGEARSLSLSMTQAGDLAYQRGIAAIPTQYFAVQHKQLMLMTTSKALTKGEKFKVAGVQLAAWGPAGLGLGGLLSMAAKETDLDLSGGVGEFIEQGVAEWSVNNMLSLAFNEDVDLDFSARFAAASGLNDNIVTAMGESMRDGEIGDLWKATLGPTSTNVNRFADAFTTASTIYNTEDKTFQDFGVGVDGLLSVFSSWNTASQARIYKSLGFWTDKKGNKLFTPNDIEIVAKGLFGINPSKLDKFYEIEGDKRKRQENIKEIVEDYYTHVNRLTTKFLADSEGVTGGGYDELKTSYEQQLRVNNAIINTHAEDAPEIMAALQRKINSNINKLGFDELTRSLQKMVVQNGRGSDAKAIIRNAVNAGFLKEEEVDQYEAFVSKMLGEKEE